MLYAVGDIHGRLDKLEDLLERIPLRGDDRLVFLGDYVDRGPDSRGVVDRLIELERHRPCTFLMGNHESMFLDFVGWRGKTYFGRDVFLGNGGRETLASYGYPDCLEPVDEDEFEWPAGHEAFYRGLQLSHCEADYLFVHAGLGQAAHLGTDLDYALRRARPQDLLWDRSNLHRNHALPATVVYGHTPRPDFQVRWNRPYSIGIDTGAVYGGPLTALRLPDESLFQT